VSRYYALPIGVFVVAVGVGIGAFAATDAWWQTVLVLVVALAIFVWSLVLLGRALETVAARRALRGEATRSDVELLQGLSDDVLEGVFQRAGGSRTGVHEWSPGARDEAGHRVRWPCPCCRCITLSGPESYDICPVCFWEDDGQGDSDADEVRGGPNESLSLTHARQNYASFGACDRTKLEFVRPPRPQEFPYGDASSAPRSEAEFIDWLVTRHPPLAPLLEEHLTDYDELLDHVFFGDVTRYADDLARRADKHSAAYGALLPLLEDLDAAMFAAERDGEDDPVDNLIWVSFVENATGDSESEHALRDRLRSFPNLAHALSHYE